MSSGKWQTFCLNVLNHWGLVMCSGLSLFQLMACYLLQTNPSPEPSLQNKHQSSTPDTKIWSGPTNIPTRWSSCPTLKVVKMVEIDGHICWKAWKGRWKVSDLIGTEPKAVVDYVMAIINTVITLQSTQWPLELILTYWPLLCWISYIKIYLHFLWFLSIETAEVVEIHPHEACWRASQSNKLSNL